MEDTRGLDEKYPSEKDAKHLCETLNGILFFAVDQVEAVGVRIISGVALFVSAPQEKIDSARQMQEWQELSAIFTLHQPNPTNLNCVIFAPAP